MNSPLYHEKDDTLTSLNVTSELIKKDIYSNSYQSHNTEIKKYILLIYG